MAFEINQEVRFCRPYGEGPTSPLVPQWTPGIITGGIVCGQYRVATYRGLLNVPEDALILDTQLERVKAHVRCLSEEGRASLFSGFGEFCRHCGRAVPGGRCSCRNDE